MRWQTGYSPHTHP